LGKSAGNLLNGSRDPVVDFQNRCRLGEGSMIRLHRLRGA
jgi:hypothetical protein